MTLRSEVRALETRLDAANNSLTNNISRLKKAAVSQQNAYQSILNGLRSQLDGETEESAKTASEYDKALDEVAQSWTNLRNQAEDLIKLVADSGEESADVSAVFALKAFTKEGKATEYTNDQQYYAAIAAAQKSAVAAQKTYDSIEQELLDKKAEYNDAVSGKSQGALPDNG
jgi:uncharacterized membrane-anchored protein YhcB (DUF1043 family)